MNYEIDLSQLTENDYIFCGIRLNAKNQKIVSVLFFHENELKSCYFKYSPKFNKVVGGIYRGASTEDFKTFKGLESAKFLKEIKEHALKMSFYAQEHADKKELATLNLEKKFKNKSPFDQNLKSIKLAYASLRLHTERAAFIELVIKAIKGD